MRAYEELGEILEERQKQYGHFAAFACIVAEDWQVEPDDVPIMMIQFKLARGITKRDTLLDIAGYALHAAEMMDSGQ